MFDNGAALKYLNINVLILSTAKNCLDVVFDGVYIHGDKLN